MSLGDRGSHGNIRYYEKQSGKTKLPYRSTALNLDGDAEISDASNLGKYLNDRAPLLYKKPIAPIYYGVNTKPTASKKSILTKVSQPIYNKPEIIPDVVDIPLPVAPIEPPVKKIGYNKPIIQQFNYMSNENKAKALQKYGSVSDIPFQGVDINQLKKGGEVEDDDDKEMVDGVASILRRVKDPKNRLQLANQLSKQFDREKVKYDLPSFLAKSKVKK